MKRFFKGSFLFLIFLLFGLQTAAADEVKITLNGTPLTFDASPCIEDGRVLVPMRGIMESLGYSVQWQEDTSTVLAEKDDIAVSMALNDRIASVNAKQIVLDVPAKLHNGRTFIPLRFLAEHSGAAVFWDAETSTVVLHSNEAADYKKEDSVVYIQTDKMQGSGVILSTDGLIVTNYHVIKNASSMQIIFHDNQIYQDVVTIVGLSPAEDIALLKINKKGLSPALVSHTYNTDDAVTAIGSPHGDRNKMTTGTITAFNKGIISTTAEIAPGSSGGGLFDAQGRLIGITYSYGNEQYLSIAMSLVQQTPLDLSIPLSQITQYPYVPTAPKNLHMEKNRAGTYAMISWTPVHQAEHYYIYASYHKDGSYKRIKNSSGNTESFYWGFPYSFEISIDPREAYYLKISAVVDGVETPLSEPLKIEK